MHKKIVFILTILTVFLFLGIRIRYQTEPSSSLFYFIYSDISNFHKINWEEIDYLKSWTFVSFEMILGILFLIGSSFLKNKIWILLSSLILFGIWLKNYILYGGIMDGDLYLKSSIYFLVSLFFLNIFNLFFRKNKIP